MEHTDTGLHVVAVRYEGSKRMTAESDPVPGYAEAGVFEALGPSTIAEPAYPDPGGYVEPALALGLLGGEFAREVAEGRSAGKPVLVVGGHCAVLPGVLGGLQKACGPAARIGLVWFDAHGDFNTPKTSISGMLGGMPVAVAVGLALPEWREAAGMAAPLPTSRLVMVDVRNLDPGEKRLIEATDATIAAAAPGRDGADLGRAVDRLADQCDMIYLHVDADVLDHRYVPNHPTAEPRGPSLPQVSAAIERVMATGKVAVFGLVSIWAHGEGGSVAVESALTVLRGAIEAWSRGGVA
ncbi:MAG: arginase family protein [Thermomicrobiales bacterium]